MYKLRHNFIAKILFCFIVGGCCINLFGSYYENLQKELSFDNVATITALMYLAQRGDLAKYLEDIYKENLEGYVNDASYRKFSDQVRTEIKDNLINKNEFLNDLKQNGLEDERFTALLSKYKDKNVLQYNTDRQVKDGWVKEAWQKFFSKENLQDRIYMKIKHFLKPLHAINPDLCKNCLKRADFDAYMNYILEKECTIYKEHEKFCRDILNLALNDDLLLIIKKAFMKQDLLQFLPPYLGNLKSLLLHDQIEVQQRQELESKISNIQFLIDNPNALASLIDEYESFRKRSLPQFEEMQHKVEKADTQKRREKGDGLLSAILSLWARNHERQEFMKNNGLKALFHEDWVKNRAKKYRTGAQKNGKEGRVLQLLKPSWWARSDQNKVYDTVKFAREVYREARGAVTRVSKWKSRLVKAAVALGGAAAGYALLKKFKK